MLELRKIVEAMAWINAWYNPYVLSDLIEIDKTWDQWKLHLALQIIAMNKTLKLNLVVNTKERKFEISKINWLLNDCVNYRTNKSMVSGKLSEILALTVNALAENNTNTSFEYEKVVWIYEWTLDEDSLIAQSEINKTLINDWNYMGKSWTNYNGKWFRDVLKMKWDDIIDILLWNISEYPEATVKAIDFLVDEENKKIINSKFKSTRMAAINIMKSILTEENSDFIIFVKTEWEVNKENQSFLIESEDWLELWYRILTWDWKEVKTVITENGYEEIEKDWKLVWSKVKDEDKIEYTVLESVEYPRWTVHKVGDKLLLTKEEGDTFAEWLISNKTLKEKVDSITKTIEEDLVEWENIETKVNSEDINIENK